MNSLLVVDTIDLGELQESSKRAVLNTLKRIEEAEHVEQANATQPFPF